jgi:hypothetical protein
VILSSVCFDDHAAVRSQGQRIRVAREHAKTFAARVLQDEECPPSFRIRPVVQHPDAPAFGRLQRRQARPTDLPITFLHSCVG